MIAGVRNGGYGKAYKMFRGPCLSCWRSSGNSNGSEEKFRADGVSWPLLGWRMDFS